MEVANATFVVAAENFVIKYFNEYVIAHFKDFAACCRYVGGMANQGYRSILFVDDQPELTDALEVAFHKKPFSVYTANSAAEALEILSDTSIDVVISDEQMPRMSGSQLLTIVRREYPNAIRIILSGQATFNATLAAINEARAHHFLVKPCSPDEIALCVANALDERDQKVIADADKRRMTEAARLDAKREFDASLETLWIAFQPVIRHDGGVFAYEALVRSQHPKLSTPYELFQAAERFDGDALVGAIDPFDRWPN